MKVIQVGIGGMGNAWINTVLQSSDVSFVGFVEVNDAVIQEQAVRYDIDRSRIFKSLAEALRSVRADAVINVTPPQFHKEVSLLAMDAGLPVLSEKPLAGTLSDAQAIVNKSNETGVLHMITQNYRYHVPIQTVKQALDSGAVGKVGAVTVEFFKGPHFGGFREEMPYPLIIDMSIHHFDLIRFFLGSDPVSVYGRSWNPPWSWYKGDASASVSLAFANGAVVAYNGSWCSNGKETPWNANWRFECEKGVVTLVNDEVYVQHLLGVEEGTGFRSNRYDDLTLIPPVVMERQAQAYLLHEFYEAVKTGKKPATTCQDNIKSLGIVFDVVQSFATGEVVQSSVSK
ncbi:MAG: Gfo/Idh/MocA family oxidoreductase [Chloroflexi bacterium]|nr:Gfo/Idh/MocA family oxidoreductase [Chloroflexota bacterium]MCC6892985.1 Gfo/Idh/MocA family oxidoreductase [Anaerolineae bacterium]